MCEVNARKNATNILGAEPLCILRRCIVQKYDDDARNHLQMLSGCRTTAIWRSCARL